MSKPPKRANLGFAEGTLIKTIEGDRKIEELKPGDLVQSHPAFPCIPGYRDHHPIPELVVQYRPVIDVIREPRNDYVACRFFEREAYDDTYIGVDQCFYADYRQIDFFSEEERYGRIESLRDLPAWACAPWIPLLHLNSIFELVDTYFENVKAYPELDIQPCVPKVLYTLQVAEFNTYFATKIGVWTLGAS